MLFESHEMMTPTLRTEHHTQSERGVGGAGPGPGLRAVRPRGESAGAVRGAGRGRGRRRHGGGVRDGLPQGRGVRDDAGEVQRHRHLGHLIFPAWRWRRHNVCLLALCILRRPLVTPLHSPP